MDKQPSMMLFSWSFCVKNPGSDVSLGFSTNVLLIHAFDTGGEASDTSLSTPALGIDKKHITLSKLHYATTSYL